MIVVSIFSSNSGQIGKLPKLFKYSFNVDSYIDTEIGQMYC